mmetsp:Transcript_32751/g.103860  ORF Transcript_32751/g.103860 Transcript_32751/m.103860 type:complete len:233 (-) Transcript_32751:479-1177(-)
MGPLKYCRKVFLGNSGHTFGGENGHRLLNCCDLLRAQLLAALKVFRLPAAHDVQFIQVLGVRSALGGHRCEICIGVHRGLLRRSTTRCLLSDLVGCDSHRLGQAVGKQLLRVVLLQFLLLQCAQLGLKLVEELLEHLHNTVGLELIRICLRRCHEGEVRLLRVAREEGLDDTAGLHGQNAVGPDLLQQRVHLRPVMGLCLEHPDGILDCIDGLAVVLVEDLVVFMLTLPLHI